MKIYQLLLVFALFLGGCASVQNNKMPSSLKAVEIKNNGDFEIFKAYDLLNNNDEVLALNSFYELFKKNKSKLAAKEAFRLAFILKDERIDELAAFAKKNLNNDNDILRLLVGYEMDRNRLNVAKKLSKSLVQKEPENPANHSILGTIYALENNNALALHSLQKAYSIEPSEINLLKLVDLLENLLNKRAQATKFAADWVNKNGCSKQVCLILLGFYAQAENVEKMVEIYTKLYDKFGGENFLKDALALYLYKKDLNAAKNLLERYPFDKGILMEIYAQLGNFDGAFLIAKALYEQNADPQFLAKMAIYKYEKNGKLTSEFELAQIAALFEEAIKKLEDPIVLNYYGYLLIDHEIDIKKGLDLCLKAHLLDQNANFIIDSVAWGYYKLGACKQASEWMKKVSNDKEFISSDEAREHLEAINKCLIENK